jgi:hypothetical protein
MTSFPPAFPFTLLQAAAMYIAPLLAGFSFANSLHVVPSLFAVATVEQYYRRTRGLDVVWLIGASVWTGISCHCRSARIITTLWTRSGHTL